ncbi:hypothetical protein EDD29_0116 [Actinocorallia herbida]|uniref:Uncharacterized protein n=1 Tax=Actinocorallia herbida TaxID=58109 RepID=A0A3N1CN53_9ACTN|nr:hypothetical protein [Actinocorallia herbida]ROO82635.1 hypothetical protein EDD29_0116 [Actinocorallia herbida]
MGSSPIAILAYGYDLGLSARQIKEADRWGNLTVPWVETAPALDEDDECLSFVDQCKRRLLHPPAGLTLVEAAQWSETFTENIGWFGVDEASVTASGVEFVAWGDDTEPSFALVAHCERNDWETSKALDLAALERRRADPKLGWDALLDQALKRLQITPLQTSPSWLLLAQYS